MSTGHPWDVRCYKCGEGLLSVDRPRFNGQEQSYRNTRAAGRLRRYCSNKCRQAAYRERVVTLSKT
jgi:hypothetical protein